VARLSKISRSAAPFRHTLGVCVVSSTTIQEDDSAGEDTRKDVLSLKFYNLSKTDGLGSERNPNS